MKVWMRLGVILLALIPLADGCGAGKDGWDFRASSSFASGDALGLSALLIMPLAAVLFLAVNRRQESPWRADANRERYWRLTEAGLACVFIFTMAAGFAWLTDPHWLEMRTPLTSAMGQ